MTGKRMLFGLMAVLVCLAFGQTAEQSGTGVVKSKKKAVTAVNSLRTATAKSADEQKPVSVPREEYAEAGRGQVSRQPVAAPKDDNNSTVPKQSEKRPDAVSRREDNTETRNKSVNRQPESAPKQRDDDQSGSWWTPKQADPEPSTSVRVRTTPPTPEPDNRLRAPTAKSLPSVERRRGSGRGEAAHGRGGRHGPRGRGDWHGPHGGWHGRYCDFDYWRYGRRHGPHHHVSWVFHWYFGPIVYVPTPMFVPDVVRLPRSRSGVYVRNTGDDDLGSRFARELRAQLRQEGLRVVYDDADAALELYLVSMDLDPNESGFASAISVSYIWNPGNRFITAQLIDVGREQVAGLADDVAGYAADVYYEYR